MGKGKQLFRWGGKRAMDMFETDTVDRRGAGYQYDNTLKNAAIQHGVVALSSPFLGEFWRTIIMLGNREMKDEQWAGYKHLKHHHFKAYVNPSIIDSSAASSPHWEESLGYPGIKLLIDRPQKIKIAYTEATKQWEGKEEELTGFRARVFQQHMDVLECLDPLRIATGIEIIDRSLRQQHGQDIQQKLEAFRSEASSKEIGHFTDNRALKLLKRQVVYAVCEGSL